MARRLSVAAACVIGLLSTPAVAQTQCLERSELVEMLKTQFNEVLSDYALTTQGDIVEIFKSAGGGTWTMVITLRSGVSCVLRAGRFWKTPPSPPNEKTTGTEK